MMAPQPATASQNPPNGPLPPPSHHHRSKSASETQRDEARVEFNKTIDGHYRHGKTGYRQVGALFLTWKDDDMQCKATEVDKLRELFETEFNFKTECYEIPSDRWETALHKKLADFCYEYDSPEDLAIIYYAGHAYTGKETKEFKLAAKIDNSDGGGDPTAFFSDIRTCLRLPRCDQLMILDCCYAAKAFAREHIGKRKFELMTSTAHDLVGPAPHLPHSFTTTLYNSLKRLIKENPKGFCTSHLYRDVYHTMPVTEPPRPPNPKPLLFDQARYSFGKIWLRPQLETDRPPKAKEEGTYLKLTFRLNDAPDLAVMNELALHLQFLPHVDQIRFGDLYAPQEQITNFMKLVVQAQKLKPLIRKIHAKRQLRRVAEMKTGENGSETPSSLLKLTLDHNHHPACDWSSASEVSDHNPKHSEQSRDQGKKSGTWPPAQATSSAKGVLPSGQLSADYKMDVPGPGTLVSTFVPRIVDTMHGISHERTNGIVARADTGSAHNENHRRRSRSPSPDRESPPEKRTRKFQ